MSDFFGKLKSGAGKVAFEAEKLAKVTRAKGELESLKNQLRDQFARLGQTVYAQRTSTEGAGSGFDEFYLAISEMEKKVDAKSVEIKQLEGQEFVAEGGAAKTPAAPAAAAPAPAQEVAPAAAPAEPQESAPAAAPAATKFCTNCGKEVPAATKFCPNCGTAL